jgi:hypothetical protein
MKMNKYATQSHVLLEGFDEDSKKWYRIVQCPAGFSGRVQWHQFSCEIKIPEKTTKIRPVLNAGWSSEPKVARTWFDDLSLNEVLNQSASHKLAEIKKFISSEGLSNNSSNTSPSLKILEYEKYDPTHWKIRISIPSVPKASIIGFAEPYDKTWQAIVYKDGKKVDVANSMPLYGSINSFEIKHTGELDVVLKFAPQFWYQVGLVVSGITVAFSIFYIIYDYKRNKKSKSLG